MQKKRFIEDLVVGEQLDDLFMVKSARLGETRAGKPYLTLTFADKSGEISGPAWDNAEALEQICSAGSVVRVYGVVQVYRDRLQLRVDNVAPIETTEYEPEEFVAASQRDAEGMHRDLEQLIGGLGNSFLKKLLRRILAGKAVGEEYKKSPAAKGIHHAYLGGLLEHSLSMARVASMLAGHYPSIDRDLLVAGALLHDIGKTVELENEVGVIEYTSIGRLKGHLVIGCELIGREAAAIKDFPEELLVHLQHLILSHHGRQEFGSPVVPMTAEAVLLSFIDDMDAKMNLIEQLSRKMKSEAPQWSEYQRSMERHLFLRPWPQGETEAGREEVPDGSAKQQSLF